MAGRYSKRMIIHNYSHIIHPNSGGKKGVGRLLRGILHTAAVRTVGEPRPFAFRLLPDEAIYFTVEAVYYITKANSAAKSL